VGFVRSDVRGTCCLRLQGESVILSTLKMETCSSEMSDLTQPTWRPIPEDGIL
jgi:hypothetical protein